jgi:hypothetical protein
MLAQQEIDRESPLIDCTVQVSPPPFDSDVSLVYAPRSADGSGIVTPAPLELRNVALDPSQDSGVGDIDTALGHHVYQITIAELVCDIPTDAENDDCAVEVAAAKQGRYVRRRRLIHANDYQPN